MSGARAAAAPWFLLAALAAVIVVQRCQSWDEPPGHDVTNYAVMGHEIVQGRALYSDLWDNRPPATNVSYAIAETLAGYGPGALVLLSIVAAVATLLGVYAAATASGGGWTGGLAAALVWTLLWSDLGLRGHEPNTEVFLNACRVLAFAAVLRITSDRRGDRLAFAAGALLALATLYKHFLGVDVVLLALVHAAVPPPAATVPAATPSTFASRRHAALRQAGIIVGVTLAVWGVLIAYFAATERLGVFYDAIVRYNLAYAAENRAGSGMIANVLHGLGVGRLWPSHSRALALLAVPVLAAAVLTVRRNRRAAALYVAWLAATQLDVSLPGRAYEHYYQLWLPPMAVSVGWLVAEAAHERSATARRLGFAAVGAVVAFLVARNAQAYRNPDALWASVKYVRPHDVTEAAAEIDGLLAPGESFYVLGDLALYYATRRSPPTGAMYFKHITFGPTAPALRARVLRDLEHDPPELVVVDRRVMPGGRRRSNSVLRWCFEHYRILRPLPGGRYTAWARRGGRLDPTADARESPMADPSRRGLEP